MLSAAALLVSRCAACGRLRPRGVFRLRRGCSPRTFRYGRRQFLKPANQRRVVAFTLAAVRFNRAKNRAQAIEQAQKLGNDQCARGHRALAHQAEQILARVGQLLKTRESKEARRAFNRVHRAEDLADERRVGGLRLKLREAALHAVQPFLALDKKFPDQIVHERSLARHESSSDEERRT